MAAVDTPTASLLSTLADAVTSARLAFPEDESALLPPTDGNSLLDVKNDLLLAYLQNLAFLIILRLRNNEGTSSDTIKLGEEAVKKLVEQRVYLERGVRPLEGRLKYQIDKVLRAADDATRGAQEKSTKKATATGANDEDFGSEVSDGSEADSDASSVDDLERSASNARPGVLRTTAKPVDSSSTRTKASATGAYKPPKITPTAMPAPPSRDAPQRKRRSNLVDEYIDDEVSTAPRAQPSIGSNSTILDRGRGGLSTRDREKLRERTDYEERNFVRLPGESKAEKRKARARGENRRDMFGGEDWTGLGGLGDRINRSVVGRKGEKESVLERREKRKRETVDGPRGDGTAIGDAFEKKRKVLQGRAEKKTRKSR